MARAAGGPYGRGMSTLQTPISALSHATVGDVMSRGVITCAPDTGLVAVAATMATHGFHAALILAPEGGRALVITDLDLIRAALTSDLDRTAADLAREPIATIAPVGPAGAGGRADGQAGPLAPARGRARRRMACRRALEPRRHRRRGRSRPRARRGRSARAPRVPSPARAPLGHHRPRGHASRRRLAHARYADRRARRHDGRPAHALHRGRRRGAPRRRRRAPRLGAPQRHGRRARRASPPSDAAGLRRLRRRPPALPESSDLARAATLMADHDATHIVVVGRTGLPLGVVSTLDVLRIVAAG